MISGIVLYSITEIKHDICYSSVCNNRKNMTPGIVLYSITEIKHDITDSSVFNNRNKT